MRSNFYRSARAYCAVLLLTLFAATLATAQTKPSAFNPTTANLPIRDMHLMTDSSGWVLADQHILWTSTAGQNWTDITPPLAAGQQIDAVYFLDSDHGWAVLLTSNTSSLPAISMAITVDSGKSWSVKPFPADTFLLQGYAGGGNLSFADDMNGWILLGLMSSSASSRGELFTTTDGGKSWSKLPDPPVAGDIQFVSEATGWLVGGVFGDELYRTQDGGRTWARKIIPLPEQVQPYVDGTYVTHPLYQSLLFTAPQNGVIAVIVRVSERNMDLLTYSTEDRGETWQLRNIRSGLEGIGKLAPFDSTFIEVKAGAGKLSVRQDSSETSGSLPSALPKLALHKADFVDSQHGWILLRSCVPPGCQHSNTALIGTEDGGKNITVLLKTAYESASPKPEIGGATGGSGIGIDSCGNIPAVYINSLYGTYGEEIDTNPNDCTVYGFYLGGVTAVAANCSIASSTFIKRDVMRFLAIPPDLGRLPGAVQYRSDLPLAMQRAAGLMQSKRYQLGHADGDWGRGQCRATACEYRALWLGCLSGY